MPSLEFILTDSDEEELEKDLPAPIKMTRQKNCSIYQHLDGQNLRMVRTRPRLYYPLIGQDLVYYGQNLEMVSSASTNFDSEGAEEEQGDTAMNFDNLEFDDLI